MSVKDFDGMTNSVGEVLSWFALFDQANLSE